MKNEIMLYSGSYFDFNNPEKSNLTIEDIAHALSHINRFTGHSERAYSVAEHCVRGSYEIELQYALDFLLHDAAESVLGDVSTPLKQMLPDYKAIERKVEQAIANRFGVAFPMPKQVKIVDTRMLASEVYDLMPAECQNWDCLQNVQKFDFTINPWSGPVAKRMFLNRYYHLLSLRKVH